MVNRNFNTIVHFLIKKARNGIGRETRPDALNRTLSLTKIVNTI